MDEEHPPMECEVCGGTDFSKDAGHFYCNECQTQSQQVQEHVFDQDDGGGGVSKKSTKKIQKEKTKKTEDMLTSWECYNYILKGLTHELVELGAKPELIVVVRCLWMKYLHKSEVFDIQTDRAPKVSILGSKKDVAILYNIKKRKRPRSRTSSMSTIVSVRRQRSTKKRALINSQYEELSQSQNLTQDSSLGNESLSNIKSGSETSEGSGQIQYNRFTNSELKRKMSRKHWKGHKVDLTGELTCHKMKARNFRPNFVRGPSNLTSFTMYGILYIGLLIVEDSIQLGDLLRFIREGHLSFGCYRHFFPEEISARLNLPLRMEKLFSHGIFRKRCAQIVHFLGVASFIHPPDLVALCSRYSKELNLPRAFFECTEKLILATDPKMTFNKRSKVIPNYEGRAMSFILFTLKLLFGLDGVTETKFSEYAGFINGANATSSAKMFQFSTWLQFIGYRRAVLRRHHLPTALRGGGDGSQGQSVDSDMYLNYLKKQRINFKGTSRHIHTEVKDYLQVLDKLLEKVGDDDDFDDDDVRYEPSLTPFLAYTKQLMLLDSIRVQCDNDILATSFAEDSLEFLLRPVAYLKSIGNPQIKHGGANDNVITEDLLYLYKKTIFAQRKSKKLVAVKISHDPKADDKLVEEYLDADTKESLRTTDVEVLLSNWQQGNAKEFAVNTDLLKAATDPYGHVKIEPTNLTAIETDAYAQHYQPFERYWLNLPTNPLAHYFPKQDVENILSKFPHSFQMVVRECERVVEQDSRDFFSEFLMTELYLVYVARFGCKSKKDKSRGIVGIRTALASCQKHW